ncbi:uncharacterized protein Dwil_GK19416 [Drosophila willistoni]|uniref:GK19416 n=1 Tax=Drosophila willistoni TaxID=7260 RepID=B4MR95_DROWI|nr:WD repeat-containing protein 5 [Drosophila willistoni]EDW74634.1 uncharacterized protein Dwil_GK19416 [Drosophila willistoni]
MDPMEMDEQQMAQVEIGDDVFKMPLPPLPPPEVKSKSHSQLPGYLLMYQLPGHNRAVTSVKFSASGNFMASASSDSSLKIWDMHAVNCNLTLTGHLMGINDVAWSPESGGSHILGSCSDDQTIRLWDSRNGQCFRTLHKHKAFVFACRFHPQGNLMASSSFDESVCLWDLRQGKCLKSVSAHWDPITSVDFNCDGSLFVTSSFDGLVRIWDTSNAQVVKSLIDDDNTPVGYVKFSPNGKYILASTLNNTLKLWNFQKPKCLRIYQGHKNEMYCLSSNFSVTSGMWVVSGSEDKSICIWNLQTKELVQKLNTLDDMVLCTDCHPKANMIVSGALQNSHGIKIWRSSE